MGTVWDAPNQQVVRADESAPWDEGSGEGEAPIVEPPPGLDAMTKDQLLDYADDHGIAVDSSMTKAEVRAAIDEAEG